MHKARGTLDILVLKLAGLGYMSDDTYLSPVYWCTFLIYLTSYFYTFFLFYLEQFFFFFFKVRRHVTDFTFSAISSPKPLKWIIILTLLTNTKSRTAYRIQYNLRKKRNKSQASSWQENGNSTSGKRYEMNKTQFCTVYTSSYTSPTTLHHTIASHTITSHPMHVMSKFYKRFACEHPTIVSHYDLPLPGVVTYFLSFLNFTLQSFSYLIKRRKIFVPVSVFIFFK